MLDEEDGRGPDRKVSVSEDGLLLREFAHRTANEIAASTAAIRIALSGRRPALRKDLMWESLQRLESFGELHNLLARPVPARVEVDGVIEALCRTFEIGHPRAAGGRLILDLSRVKMDGPAARRLALVAAELVRNAVKYAMTDRHGTVRVMLRRLGGDVILSITDDGPGIRVGVASEGTGLGRGIVADLVALSGGTLTTDTGHHGTSIRVVVPFEQDGDDVFVGC